MTEESTPKQPQETAKSEASSLVEAGKTSLWLTENGFAHEAIERDRVGQKLSKLTASIYYPLLQRFMLTGTITCSFSAVMI